MCLQCGIGIFDFWDYTLDELYLLLDAYNQRELRRMKEEAINTYMLADLIGASVSRLMNEKAKYPQIYEVYPNLFEAPKEPQQQDWRVMKERMMKFANTHNTKRGENAQ